MENAWDEIRAWRRQRRAELIAARPGPAPPASGAFAFFGNDATMKKKQARPARGAPVALRGMRDQSLS